eukprot:4444647-Amphidinium_carterae.1
MALTLNANCWQLYKGSATSADAQLLPLFRVQMRPPAVQAIGGSAERLELPAPHCSQPNPEPTIIGEGERRATPGTRVSMFLNSAACQWGQEP